MENDAFKHAGIPRLEEGMNLMMGGHRPAVYAWHQVAGNLGRRNNFHHSL